MGEKNFQDFRVNAPSGAAFVAAAMVAGLLSHGTAAAQRVEPKPIAPQFNKHVERPAPKPPEPQRRIEPTKSLDSAKRQEPLSQDSLNSAARRKEPGTEPRPIQRPSPDFNKAVDPRFVKRGASSMRRAELYRAFSEGNRLTSQASARVKARSARQLDLVTNATQRYLKEGRRPVILGSSGIYRPLAKKVNGQYFWSASGDFAYASRRGQLNPKLEEKIWQRNKSYIDRSLAGGMPILFGTPVAAARKQGGYSKELSYLRSAVRNSNGGLRYVRENVKTRDGRNRKVIVGVESVRPPAAAPEPAPKAPR